MHLFTPCHLNCLDFKTMRRLNELLFSLWLLAVMILAFIAPFVMLGMLVAYFWGAV
jgi:hypothetical protein